MPSELKANILLVDDRPENLIALEATLDKLNQNLVKASSGEEALRCLLKQDFAVILLDVQMPGIDGFETAMLIRQRERSRHVPIIFLTAFSTSDSFVSKGYSLGAVDYLLKPINPSILTSKVSVFVDLFKKTMEVQRQASELAALNSELSESEERFRSLCVCSPIGIFLTDTEGRCTYRNPSCQEICDFKNDENCHQEWAKCIHPEDSDRILRDWSRCNQQGRPYSNEFRIHTSNGSVRWAAVRTSPMFSEENQLLGHVGTIEDITERKQAEAAREQLIREQAARQQAEEANRMKDEFLAIVSHELRTPLNSIMGWSKLLLTKQFDETTTNRALAIIERNARAQAQLIEDILDVSKIMRGQLRLSIQTVNLLALIESVIETVRPSAQDKNIQLQTQLNPAVKMVSADPERLQQIIWNLLSNAIKFTTEEGQITIKVEQVVQRIRVTDDHLPQPAPYAQIQVIDTGIGISPEFLPHVFDRFRQADSSTTRPYGGLGLGLSIVRHLVELHGGRIDADSEGEGKGATFTVYLPLAAWTSEQSELQLEPVAEKKSNGKKSSPSLARLQVLVVEDHPDTRDYIKKVLEQSGAKVIAVDCVSEAIKYLEQSSPDVLVSDIGMPQEDGLDLIRKVRDLEEQQGGKIPAIALTAYARAEDHMQAIAAGFQMHVPKPVEPTKLLAVVAKVAGRIKNR